MKNTAFKRGITAKDYDNTYVINFGAAKSYNNHEKLLSPKICAINIECGCGETNFDVLMTHNADFGRIYDRFEKKCVFCGQDIRVEFNFNI